MKKLASEDPHDNFDVPNPKTSDIAQPGTFGCLGLDSNVGKQLNAKDIFMLRPLLAY